MPGRSAGWDARWKETIDCRERGRPVRTERVARKTLAVFDIGIPASDRSGRDVRAPSISRPEAGQKDFLKGRLLMLDNRRQYRVVPWF